MRWTQHTPRGLFIVTSSPLTFSLLIAATPRFWTLDCPRLPAFLSMGTKSHRNQPFHLEVLREGQPFHCISCCCRPFGCFKPDIRTPRHGGLRHGEDDHAEWNNNEFQLEQSPLCTSYGRKGQ